MHLAEMHLPPFSGSGSRHTIFFAIPWRLISPTPPVGDATPHEAALNLTTARPFEKSTPTPLLGLTRINARAAKTYAHAHINYTTEKTHCLAGTAHHSLLQHYPHTPCTVQGCCSIG